MTSRKRIFVVVVALVAVLAFFAGADIYRQRTQSRADEAAGQQNDRLVRPHAPVLGPRSAPVTLVEFFDPACEACRAFYPHVKALLAQYPKDLRLVIRYAPFHPGSNEMARLLEAARLQDRYVQVLEAVLHEQPRWADHGRPDLTVGYQVATQAGLDLQQALAAADSPEIRAAIAQDGLDLKELAVQRTPTFFVNGRRLTDFGPQQLAALVAEEVAKAGRAP